jgi:hypothetical protein
MSGNGKANENNVAGTDHEEALEDQVAREKILMLLSKKRAVVTAWSIC